MENQLDNDIKFLKTFFSGHERQVDECQIAHILTQCGNDREKAFDRLMQISFKPL